MSDEPDTNLILYDRKSFGGLNLTDFYFFFADSTSSWTLEMKKKKNGIRKKTLQKNKIKGIHVRGAKKNKSLIPIPTSKSN